jgi:hypothetical protein
MRKLGRPLRNIVWAILLVCCPPLTPAKDKASLPTTTWAADKPGCSFSRGDDGKYRYDLKTGDLEITIAADSREVQEIRRRPVPVLGLFATIHYSGKQSIDVNPTKLTLEFLLHSKIVQNALQT